MSGTWQPLSNQPTFSASTMLLLADGTVMCQDGGLVNWWRLRPNVTGDYVHGTWSQLAPMYDGRLWVIGPNGPIPVEPYPAIAGRARDSLSKLVEAVTELRSLGDELITERNKVNAQLAPAFDPELEEFAKKRKKG